jgi:hypothetical protein
MRGTEALELVDSAARASLQRGGIPWLVWCSTSLECDMDNKSAVLRHSQECLGVSVLGDSHISLVSLNPL